MTICTATGKKRHRKRSGAHRQAKALDRAARNARKPARKSGSGETTVYVCEYCGGFHVAARR